MLDTKVAAFSSRLEDHLFELHETLISGAYRHDPYEHFFVHDPKRRYISEATVLDRVVHQAIVQVIEPIIEKSFIFDSYSSRTGKGIHKAVERLEQFLREATKNYSHNVYALKCDIRKFFDSIRHDVLMKLIRRKVPDAELCRLIQIVVNSYGTDPDGMVGLPLGNSTSQLFANLYLTSFDHFAKEQLHMPWYLRFCDDFLMIAQNRLILEKILPRVRDFIFHECALELHPNKVEIRKLSWGIDFVGQVVRPHYRVTRTKTVCRIFRNVRLQCIKYKKGATSSEQFRQIVQSYLGIFSHGANYKRGKRLREEVWRSLCR